MAMRVVMNWTLCVPDDNVTKRKKIMEKSVDKNNLIGYNLNNK